MWQFRRFSKAGVQSQSIVEFAILLPVLLALLLGVIEIGWLARNHVFVGNGAAEGARAASMGLSTTIVTQRVMYAMAPSLVYSSANGDTCNTQYASTANTNLWIAWPADSGTNNGVATGNLIRVTLSVRHNDLTGMFPFLTNHFIVQSSIMKRQ